jgi:VCBS repeat-containing protein
VKFKKDKYVPSWRQLLHTDNEGDTLDVSVTDDPASRQHVIIMTKGDNSAVALTRKQAIKFATNLLKELTK